MCLTYSWVFCSVGIFETSICLLCAMIIMMRIDHSFILMIVYMYHYCSYPKIVCPFTEEILVRFMVFGCLLVIVLFVDILVLFLLFLSFLKF